MAQAPVQSPAAAAAAATDAGATEWVPLSTTYASMLKAAAYEQLDSAIHADIMSDATLEELWGCVSLFFVMLSYCSEVTRRVLPNARRACPWRLCCNLRRVCHLSQLLLVSVISLTDGALRPAWLAAPAWQRSSNRSFVGRG